MAIGEGLRAGATAVLRSKRLLLWAAATTALVALPAAIFAGRAVHATGARRSDALEIAKSVDLDFLHDLRAAHPTFDADVTALVVASLVLSFFVRPFLWGGYAGVAASPTPLSFARFVREGGAVYWKFLRISAIGLVLLWGVSLALKPLLETFEGWAAGALGEDLARQRRWVAHALAFAAFCAVAAVLDYARVGVRMRRKPGVLRELAGAALFVVQHPFRTAGLYLAGLVLEVVLCAPLLLLVAVADGAYVGTSVVVLLLGQCVVAARESARLFHLAGAWRLRELEERAPASGGRGLVGDTGDLLEERLPWHVS